jgi:hypothetical protein
MLTPEPVTRDRYGFWLHSALRTLHDGQEIADHEAVGGMELRFVVFEFDAPEDVRDRYYSDLRAADHDWIAAVWAWEPTRPEGAGWFLIGLYDTDDGPYACFARPKGAESLRRLEILYTSLGDEVGAVELFSASGPDVIYWEGRAFVLMADDGRYVETGVYPALGVSAEDSLHLLEEARSAVRG